MGASSSERAARVFHGANTAKDGSVCLMLSFKLYRYMTQILISGSCSRTIYAYFKPLLMIIDVVKMQCPKVLYV